MVLWMIWLGITASMVMYQFQFGHGWRHGADARSALALPITWVTFVFLLGAAVVRWLVIPRIRSWRAVLAWMIVGLALSETVGFYGIFLYPSDMPASKLAVFVLALLSAGQFMPVYAGQAAAAGTAERQ